MAPDMLLDLLNHLLTHAEHLTDSTAARDASDAARLVVRADQTVTAVTRFAAMARRGRGRHRRR